MTEIILISIVVIPVGVILYTVFMPVSKEDAFPHFKDDLLYDPDTGAEITLEQAESGIWDIPDQEINKVQEIDQLDSTKSDDLAAYKMAEFLEKEGYILKEFSDGELDILNGLGMLNSYSDWHYKEQIVFTKGEEIIFFPVVRQSVHRVIYRHVQLMFWIKIKNAGGHYYFTPKMEVEKALNFAVKDEFRLKNYKATALKKANGQSVSRIVKMFDEVKDIEMEVKGNNLFIKTLKPPGIEEYSKIKSIIDKI